MKLGKSKVGFGEQLLVVYLVLIVVVYLMGINRTNDLYFDGYGPKCDENDDIVWPDLKDKKDKKDPKTGG